MLAIVAEADALLIAAGMAGLNAESLADAQLLDT